MMLATGVYTYDHLPQPLLNRNEDQIAEIFVHEIENGIQGTGIKPAFIKCAADEPGVNPNVEKIHRAAARASIQTGRPIMAHSRPASGTGLDQMRVFTEEGVDPAKVQIAHTGDTDEPRLHRALLDTGCWIGLDRYGLDLFLPTEQPQRHHARPAGARLRGADVPLAGLLLDARLVPAPRWRSILRANEVPDWSMTFLFEQIIPGLKEAGMTDEQLDQMMVENPKGWLGA